jgi:predicted HD superfamily hydrolase involved in NAD metabolism
MLLEQEINHRLAIALTFPRYQHSLRVQETAGILAVRYGADPVRARLAGLVHDCAKGMAPDELLRRAICCGITPDAVEEVDPELLHGPVGACLCAREFGISDPEILGAVRKHTTGDGQMTRLEKIIYLADYIEPGRTYPGIDILRNLADRDLDCAVLHAASLTIRFVSTRGKLLHPRTLAVRESLSREIAHKGVDCFDRGNETV